LKIDFGPGYRVYFKKRADILIVLLCGGDKSSQKEDIKTAKKLASEGGF
jgi:putative addiction module killer protein